MNKLLAIVVLGLILTGCAGNKDKDKGSMKGAMDKFYKQLDELKAKKKLVEENCLKNAREKFEDPEKILADYKICMVEKGYKNE